MATALEPERDLKAGAVRDAKTRIDVDGMTKADKHVLILQPRIQHYRVPVFDRLRQVADGEYGVVVRGTMRDGAAVGGGERPFFVESQLRSVPFGPQPIEWWPKTLAYIRQMRPAAVVTTLYPSNLSTWRLPAVCRQLGIPCIGWTKVHSRSKLRAAQMLKRRLFSKYDYILTYGTLSRDELIALGYPSDRIFVAQNTIDTDRIFERREQYAADALKLRRDYGLDKSLIVLCIAKFEPQKRHTDLLRAWTQIRTIDERLNLVLIGSGSRESEILQRVESINDDRIHFLGRVPAGQDYGWIAAANINVQCGAVGLAINQSMATGVPTVIADEQSADCEALRHKKTGWRYPPGDVPALVKTVQEVLADREASDRITANAQDAIRNDFSIDQMVSGIHRCILAALAPSEERS